MGNIIELIRHLAIEHIDTIIAYTFSATVIMIILILSREKKATKYRMWKKDTIKIGGFTREWEVSTDEVLKQLWDENQRLENEVELMRRKFSALSIKVFIITLFLLAWGYFLYALKGNQNKNR